MLTVFPEMSKRAHSPIVDENSEVATALLAADVDYDSEDTMRYETRKKTKTATEGTLNIDYVRDQTSVTNSRASPFAAALAEQEETRSEIKSIKSKLDSTKKELDSAKKEWAGKHEALRERHEALESRFYALEGSETEREIRHRFLACIKRDILGTASDEDYVHIGRANSAAHTGNCVRDAHLYQCAGGRTDYACFEKIYGLQPGILLFQVHSKFFLFHDEDNVNICIATSDAIPLLDRHATLLANKDRPPPPRFHEAFHKFVKEFKRANFPKQYLKENENLARCHYEFLASF